MDGTVQAAALHLLHRSTASTIAPAITTAEMIPFVAKNAATAKSLAGLVQRANEVAQAAHRHRSPQCTAAMPPVRSW